MKSLINSFLFAILVSGAQADVTIGPITNPANGHSYYLLSSASWTASEAEALTLGGHLTAINDLNEQVWVMSTFGANGSLWFGLTDASAEGAFAWTSGEPVTYLNWYSGEPNASTTDEDYVLAWWPGYGAGFSGRWNDIANTNLYNPLGVVEVVPEPSAAMLLGFGISLILAAQFRRSSRSAAPMA